MSIYYSYLFSLVFLFLLTHWINTASLRSFSRSPSKWSWDRRHPLYIVDNEVTTSEPVLSRRRPQLISNGRRRRWSKDEDNDEVEIPIDETNIEQSTSTFLIDDLSPVNSTITEGKHPLLRQDFAVINETDEATTLSMNEDLSENNNTEQSIETTFPLTTANEIIDINSTEAEILPTNGTNINQEISNENNETITDNLTTIETINIGTDAASIPISINQTIEETSIISQTEFSTTNEFKEDTAIILMDYTTIPLATINHSQTSIDSKTETVLEYSTTVVDEVTNTITALVETQNETALIQEGIDNTTITSDTTSIQERIDNTTITSDTTQNDTTLIQEGTDNTTITSDTTQNDTTSIQERTDNTTITSDMTETDSTVTDQRIAEMTTISDVTQKDIEGTDQRIYNTTTILTVTQNNTEITDQGINDALIFSDVTQNDTSTVVSEEDEYSNETIRFSSTTTTAKPICDRSCQCFRKCPYGFEMVNNTCQCDPPCKNYQCFGNDTCTITKKGQPICQPKNGSEHDRPIRCYQPQDAGYHDVDMHYYNRWYYNADQDTCYSFVYRGLGGNENNFQTLHECHLECITCAPTPDPGTCLAHIPMWYYDYKKNQCSQFHYSGCKGNENKFLRKQVCIDTCVTRIVNL